MRYEEVLEEKVKRFCELSNIDFNNGKIAQRDINKVQIFIKGQAKIDRRHTRNLEMTTSMKIGIDIIGIKKGLSESPIEDFMLQAFERKNIAKYCKQQHKIGTKRVDFAFPDAMLVVECDGKEYHFTDQSQIERDQLRDKYLARKRWRVVHFDGLIIRRDIDLCMEKVVKLLKPFIKEI